MRRSRSHSDKALVADSRANIFSRTCVYTITSTNSDADSAGSSAFSDRYARAYTLPYCDYDANR